MALTSPGCEPVFLEQLHLEGRGPVVHLQDPDKVGDRQHTNEPEYITPLSFDPERTKVGDPNPKVKNV